MDRPLELEPQPLYDAVLVHGFGLSQENIDSPVTLSTRSKFAVRAAYFAYD